MTLCWRLKDDKFVVWDKPAAGDKMAPFDNPDAHIDLVWFNSAWDYYKVAHHGSHSLTHSLVAGKTTTVGSVVMLGQSIAQDQVLYTHNLGYVPRYMIAIGGKLIQNMHPVQVVGTDQVRSVSFYATTTELRCINIGTSSGSNLPAATITYDVLLFRPPMDGYDVDEAMFSGTRGVLAKGIIKGTDVMLRRSDGADASPFDISLSPALDIDRGSVKWFHSDGSTTVTGAYAGSFSAPTSIQMALTE